MRRIKMRSGGFVYILGANQPAIKDQICMSEAEYSWTLKLVAGLSDMKDREEFWAGIIERKLENPDFNVLEAFPIDDKQTDKQTIAVRYSQDIINMLKGKTSGLQT